MNLLYLLANLLSPGWVGSAIGLAGILVAVITYRRSLEGAKPVCIARSLSLLNVKGQMLPNDIEVRFSGSPVERLTKTELIVCNSGRRFLNGNDIVADDPIRFVFGGTGAILSANVSRTTKITNKSGF
jgi:hypothetical protein